MKRYEVITKATVYTTYIVEAESREDAEEKFWENDVLETHVDDSHTGEDVTWVHEEAITDRLEYLRSQLRAEKISYAEIAELQGLAALIPDGDVELREAIGLPEGSK